MSKDKRTYRAISYLAEIVLIVPEWQGKSYFREASFFLFTKYLILPFKLLRKSNVQRLKDLPMKKHRFHILLFTAAAFLQPFFSLGQSFIPAVHNPVIDTLLTSDSSAFWTRWKSDPCLIPWGKDSLLPVPFCWNKKFPACRQISLSR